jgi:hypothetical protein
LSVAAAATLDHGRLARQRVPSEHTKKDCWQISPLRVTLTWRLVLATIRALLAARNTNLFGRSAWNNVDFIFVR